VPHGPSSPNAICVKLTLHSSVFSLAEPPNPTPRITSLSEHAHPEDDGDAEAPDPRLAGAFRAWLEALATDPDAATAAAMAYESLAPDGRDAWLDAIEVEAPLVPVPAIALYAPLLGVETDERRRARIDAALASGSVQLPRARTFRALAGHEPSGVCVAVIVVPLYLDFVELLVCRYEPDVGIQSARRGPLLRATDVTEGAVLLCELGGATLTEVPFPRVVEDLAHALMADVRRGRPPPEPLRTYDFLFTLDLGYQDGRDHG